jgi:hypothetical protein
MVSQGTQTRTAMVDGKEMSADKAASIHEVREIFAKLKKALKQIALYRHNVDRYPEYLAPCHAALDEYLSRRASIELRVDALAYKYMGEVVFEDESRDNNIIYPFWQQGIRLLIFKSGLSAEELLKFLLLTLGTPGEDRGGRSDDIITRLWKAEFTNIEYIVVEAFKVMADEEPEEVEVEVEKVVAYLYRQLQSNSDDIMRFARISVEDLDLELQNIDQIRGAVVQGVTASTADKSRVQTAITDESARIMPKLVTVLFQLLELDTTEENFEDVAEAFVQLLDALLLGNQFGAIQKLRSRFNVSAQKPNIKPGTRDLIVRCAERFTSRMGESQRLQMLAQILNQGVIKEPEGVKEYLFALGDNAIQPLIEVLETLELPPNRRLIADILAELGKDHYQLFITRLTHPSSNLVKDMLYILDKIDPAEKYAVFAHVLKHPNTILRLETLTLIGRNPSEECFNIIRETAFNHEDAQMRGQAMRSLPNYDGSVVAPLLIKLVESDRFEKMEEPERKAVFTAIGQTASPITQEYLTKIVDQKTGIFGKSKTDDMKMLAILGFEANPSLPALQKLAEIAKDTKRHSKEVNDAARSAAIQMQARIMGAGMR